MIKNYLYIIIFIISSANIFSQEIIDIKESNKNEYPELNDGPYVFIEKNKLVEKKIVNGKVFSKNLKNNAYDTLFVPDKQVFKNVKNIAALSDIHGQYELAIELLRTNEIIDKNLNWNFGKGHLVIVGDVFDRGDKVNELLLLIYKLEQQAKDKGGRVHFLLGNHEFMVLQKDLRYINKKYWQSSKLLGLDYNELYNDKTVIGRWLRSKSTIIKINKNVFVHGGVSKDFLSSIDFDIESINTAMRKSIDRSEVEMDSTGFYNVFYGPKSLIWYRGYFYDNLTNQDVSDILKLIKSKHIIVGHCSNKEVVNLFDNKVFGVDSSIQLGKYGEILFIKKNNFFRGTLNGKKIQF